MKTFLSTILLVFLLGLSATVAWGDAATTGVTGYCAIWGPTSYVTNSEGVFNAAINANWVNATCKWKIADFDLGKADVRTYSGEEYNVCTIWFGEYPSEYHYVGSGQSTISASGQVTVKCKADITTCSGACP
jgi:hypothetical protein